MDYSLLLGIHDTNREDAREEPEEEEEDDDYDSGGSGGAALTPPDSPGIPFLNLENKTTTKTKTLYFSDRYFSNKVL